MTLVFPLPHHLADQDPLPASGTPAAALLRLRPGRAHELCGPARRLLAVWVMAQLPAGAPVIWIAPRWGVDRLYPPGLRDWVSPEGLIHVAAARDSDALACTEDALRAGAVPLVVVELPQPPALTPLRRLHLAAETGLDRRRSAGRAAELHALVLTPDQGGTPGVESRWHLAACPAREAPHYAPVQSAWHLQRLRARMAPPAAWHIDARGQAHPLTSEPDAPEIRATP